MAEDSADVKARLRHEASEIACRARIFTVGEVEDYIEELRKEGATVDEAIKSAWRWLT